MSVQGVGLREWGGDGNEAGKCSVTGFHFPLGRLFCMAFASGCLETSECERRPLW